MCTLPQPHLSSCDKSSCSSDRLTMAPGLQCRPSNSSACRQEGATCTRGEFTDGDTRPRERGCVPPSGRHSRLVLVRSTAECGALEPLLEQCRGCRSVRIRACGSSPLPVHSPLTGCPAPWAGCSPSPPHTGTSPRRPGWPPPACLAPSGRAGSRRRPRQSSPTPPTPPARQTSGRGHPRRHQNPQSHHRRRSHRHRRRR